MSRAFHMKDKISHMRKVLVEVIFLVFILSVVEVIVKNDSLFVADKNLRFCDFQVFNVQEKVNTVQNTFHFVVCR